MDNKELNINDFLNSFLSYYYEIRSILFDNIDIFYDMSIFVNELTRYEVSQEKVGWDKISKTTFFENIELIDKFFIKLGIKFSINKIISDGTLDITTTNYEKIQYGLNSYLGEHKSIKVYNNGYITDSIIWVHEISHYRNQPEEGRTGVNDLLTEALAHAMSLVYADYLENEGYEYEAIFCKYDLINTFRNTSSLAYTISKIIKLYEITGKVSKETYIELYGGDDYDEEVSKFIETISNNPYTIFNTLWYTLSGALSIYMYEEYRKNNNYANNLEELNTSLLNGDDINKCLRIIGITGYNKDSLSKIRESYDEYKKELKITSKKLIKK